MKTTNTMEIKTTITSQVSHKDMNTTALKYLQENQHSIFAIAYAAVSEGSPLLPNLNKIGYDENKLEELSGFLGQVLGDSAEEEA